MEIPTGLPGITKADQDQNMENHEIAHAELSYQLPTYKDILSSLPEITRPDQHQNMQNHDEKTHSEQAKERQKDECVISINDKLESLPGSLEFTRLDQHQDIQNHDEKTHSEQPDGVISRREKLEKAKKDDDSTSWGKLCIYKVPGHLKKNDWKFYIPQTVSLGPFHHEKIHLKSMEDHKWRAVHKVLKRENQDIEMYMDAMKELEGQVRASYQGKIDMDSDNFRQMLVVDGLFVLEFFMGTLQGFQKMGYAPTDPVFAIPGSILSIQLDMLMLENQLPLFLLNRLLSLQTTSDPQPRAVEKLIVQFFGRLMQPTFKKMINPNHQSKLKHWFEKSIDSSEEGLHCLDVFRRSLLQYTASLAFSHTSVGQYQNVPCVTELKSAGIKFKKKNTDHFWNIDFKRHHLEIPEIPKLLIHEGTTTKSLFLNLIAFEKYHRGLSNALTSYVVFMENLISSPEDVNHLHACGIIERRIESESDVVDLFKQLRKKVDLNLQESYLSPVSNNVDDYYKKNPVKVRLRHKYLVTLRQRYFNNPWAYLSCFAAVLLLILTLIQTVFTVSAYFYPRS